MADADILGSRYPVASDKIKFILNIYLALMILSALSLLTYVQSVFAVNLVQVKKKYQLHNFAQRKRYKLKTVIQK